MPGRTAMNVSKIAAWALFVGAATAYLVDPPAPAASDTVSDCSNWAVAADGDTCASIASDNAITVDQFTQYNPSLKSTCSLVTGNAYCVEENWGIPPSSTSTVPSTTSSAGNGVTTPTPTQTGMVSNCSKFYLVKSGDSCYDIAANNSISLDDFYAWNPAVKDDCSGLQAKVNVCVGIIGGTTSTTPASTPATTTATTPTNGISTPTPTQTGMVSNCNKFYLVKSGDSCYDIAANNSIALDDFYAWNPAVKTDCSGLQAKVNVCVGIIGGTTTKPSSTLTTSVKTTPSNGIATPTPTQDGMTTNCNKFYDVKSGDGCYNIASDNSISLDDFYAWNPAVKSDCSSLWPNYYVCVGIIGGTTKASTTPTPTTTTTTPGNGITTPTPTQSGMTGNCKKFYQVKSGDGCYDIAQTYSITLDNFYAWNPAVKTDCSALWPNYYVCVGI